MVVIRKPGKLFPGGPEGYAEHLRQLESELADRLV